MSAPNGSMSRMAFNNSIWEHSKSQGTEYTEHIKARSPPSPSFLENGRPSVGRSAGSQETNGFVSVEKVVDYQESVSEYSRGLSVQYDRTQDRRSLAGTVYGPPIGAPPGHYKRPSIFGAPEPRIARMGASTFKKGSVNSVIEVLLEEPRFTSHGRRRLGELASPIGNGRNTPVKNSLNRMATVVDSIQQKPKRIRIRSPRLLKALERIAERVQLSFLTSGTASLVFLYPFKLFVTLEPYIRERVAQLEKELQTSESRASLAVEHKISFAQDDISSEAVGKDSKSTRFVIDDEDNSETLQHLKLLVEVFDTVLKPMFEMRQEIKERTLTSIAYHDLWHLFQYGQDVRASDSDAQVYRVLRWTGGREPLAKHGFWAELQARAAIDAQVLQKSENRAETFFVECVYFEFDGHQYGPVQKTFAIRKYDGEKPITSLPVFPLDFDPNHAKLRKSLISRGNTYLELSQPEHAAHKHYSGLTLDEPHEEVDSQIIVDTKMAMLRYYTALPPVGVFNLIGHNLRETYEETVNPTVPDGVCAEDGCCDNDLVHKDYNWDLQHEDKFLEDRKAVLAPTTDASDLEDDEKLLLPPYVYGFILRSRKWAMFNIDLIRDVEYTSGFDDLVLPPGHKETVRALVANHARIPTAKTGKNNSQKSMDLVRGKGKGLVILLHGAPGVGKTSTAECVADSTKRPLFPITCGDIGDTASEVEANLESSFQLAHKWGCVLLLDEADIFLQKRDKADIKRNSIVSVFLRVLEYYSGILFLTTNRVGLFDPAFRSRIHISLYYPGLQKEATVRIWKMHLARAQEIKGDKFKIRSKEILKFAKEHYMELKRSGSGSWNGRQIRNAFQTAIALAEFEAAEENERRKDGENKQIELTREHFATVAQASKEFDKYLRSTLGGQTEADLARLEQTRVDDYHSIMDRMDQAERSSRGKDKGRRKKRVETDSEDSESLDSEESDEDDDESKKSESGSEDESESESESEVEVRRVSKKKKDTRRRK